jgi:hypothetical protein
MAKRVDEISVYLVWGKYESCSARPVSGGVGKKIVDWLKNQTCPE